MPILETERLTLEQFTADDAPFVLRLLNEPPFLHFIGDKGVRTLDDAREYLASGPIDSYRKHGFGLYVARLRRARTPIGMCGLLKRDSLADVDIGFAFLTEFQGHGYASEAARAVMDYGKDTLGLDRIVAVTSQDNERSARLLEKIGLQFERMITLDGQEDRLFAPGNSRS